MSSLASLRVAAVEGHANPFTQTTFAVILFLLDTSNLRSLTFRISIGTRLDSAHSSAVLLCAHRWCREVQQLLHAALELTERGCI